MNRTENGQQIPIVPEDEPKETLSPDKAKLLFFLSFRLSQGDQGLQYAIFEWLHRKHPTWRIVAKDLEPDSITRNEHFLLTTPGAYHTAVDIKRRDLSPKIVTATTNTELGRMEYILEKGRGVDQELTDKDYALKLAGLILQEDGKRLLPQEENWPHIGVKVKPATGRKRQGEYIPGRPETDPWSSQFIDYGLRGATTGVPEYDKMLAEIKAFTQEEIRQNKKWKQTEPLKQLPAIISSYDLHHPKEEKIRLPQLTRK